MGLKDKFKGTKKKYDARKAHMVLPLDDEHYIKPDLPNTSFMLVYKRPKNKEAARAFAERMGLDFDEDNYDETATNDVVIGYHGRLSAALAAWTRHRTTLAVAAGVDQVVAELKAQTAILQRIHDAEDEWWLELPKTKTIRRKGRDIQVKVKRGKSAVDEDEAQLNHVGKEIGA